MNRSTLKRIVPSAIQTSEWKTWIKEFPFPRDGNDLYALNPQTAIAQVVCASHPVEDNYLAVDHTAQESTPDWLVDQLGGFGEPGGQDAVLLNLGPKFFEIDPERDMPVSGRRNPRKPFGTDEVAQLAIIRAAGGMPFALLPEAGYDLIMPVSPAPGKKRTRSSKGGLNLDPHVDNMPFDWPFRPDFFSLTGLVSTERVETQFMLIDDVLAALHRRSPKYERVLREPRYRWRTPASFHFDGSQPVPSALLPIIEDGPDGRPVFNYNQYSLLADERDKQTTDALDALASTLSDPRVVRGEWLSPGMVLLLSNTRALHARGQVRGKRYLGRLYGKRDLTHLRDLPSGGDRVCRYRFMMAPTEIVDACRRRVLEAAS